MRLVLVGVLSTSAIAYASKEAKEAHATSTHIYQITDGPWYLHPTSPTIHSGISDLMPTDTNFDISCWQESDNVSGDTVWDYGTNLATGHQGYVADKGTDTPATMGDEPAQLTALGIPQCGSDSSIQEFDTSSGYNAQGAANWALAHAKDRQPYSPTDEDCTWFVSQAAIEGGGLLEDDQFNLHDRYGHPHIPGTNIGSGAVGTTDTWLAPKFIEYILKKYPQSTWQELQFSQNNQPDARPGDIIAYGWDDSGKGSPYGIDHLAMVVDDAPNTQYPEISQWGNLEPGQVSSPYQKTGWTWSAYYNSWIQAATGADGAKAYPNPHAYLLHIVVPSY